MTDDEIDAALLPMIAKHIKVAQADCRILPLDRIAFRAGMREAARVARKMDKPTVRQVNPLTAARARTFKLVRDDDETGISGVGTVAEGIEFSNGMCAMCWLTAMHSVAVYPNVRQLEAIHGHNGRTRVVFDSYSAAGGEG